MNEKIKTTITEIFDKACIEQFESVGCRVKETTLASSSSEVMSSYIAAGSDDISISLVLKTPRILLAQTMPVVDVERINDPTYQEDWNGELANRFLGRLKNKLVMYDCRLKIGLPELLSESDLKHFVGDGDEIVRHFSISAELTESVVDCYLYISIHNENFNLVDHGIYEDNRNDGDLVFL